MGVDGGIKTKEFLDSVKLNVSVESSQKYEYAVTVAESITRTQSTITEDEIHFKVDGVEKPFNHYYGDALMLLKANKLKLKVRKFVIAKHRKNAFHDWSEYVIEYEAPIQYYYFYSSFYTTNGGFIRKIGDLGTRAEYEKLISNEGK